MKTRIDLKGAKEMDRALGELGEEIALKVGVAAVRAGALQLRRELEATAPVGPNAPKNGRNYGHLKDNVRHRRQRVRKPYTVRYIVNFGRAFWAYFREVGTVRQPPRPWAVPTFDRMKMQLLETILDTLRKRTAAAARKLARGQRPPKTKSMIGHNGGPGLGDD